MLLSMTGYGAGSATVQRGTADPDRSEEGSQTAQLTVELRAVNHRYLDVRMRVSSELSEHASKAEAIVRKQLVRGRVEVSARLADRAGEPTTLSVERARAAMVQLTALRDELSPDEPVPLSLLSIVPDLFAAPDPPEPEALAEALITATRDACAALVAMRRREGEALEKDLRERLATVETCALELSSVSGDAVEAHRTRLRERIERLLSDVEVELDTGRLEHEIAIHADRADVSEELTRLSSHCAQFRELLGSNDGVGRKLDFLLQEMNREVNTIGSKSADADAARRVVDLKAEVERIREQVQNVL